jgi:hypothetical protein
MSDMATSKLGKPLFTECAGPRFQLRDYNMLIPERRA